MPRKSETPAQPKPTLDELWADVHKQFEAIKKASYDEGFEAAKQGRPVEPHEVGELLHALSVLKTHCNNAMGELHTLQTRIEELNSKLMLKK
jgi:hypothetical protein